MSISIAHELAEKSMAYVAHEVESLVKPAIEGFLRFVKEPMEYKRQWMFDFYQNKDPDDGWIKRKGKGHDYKEHVHFRPRLPCLLRERGVNFSRHIEWLDACAALYSKVRHLGEDIALELDEVYPTLRFGERHKKSHGHVLRLCHYDAVHTNGSILAQPHFDRDLVTLHIADNRPGLHAHDKLIPVQNGKIVAFVGDYLDYFTEGKFKALFHGAIEGAVDPHELATERWAVIFFNQLYEPPKGMPYWTRPK